MDDARSLTVQEVADRLGISIDKVYRRIHRGDIKAYQVRVRNLHYRVYEADLQEYIAAGHIDVLTPPAHSARDMLGTSEVARMTGFTVETIRRMCYDGRLPYVRGAGLRGHLRVSRDAVQELLTVAN